MITAKAIETLGKDIIHVSEKISGLEKTLGDMNDKLDELIKNANVVKKAAEKAETGPEKSTPDKSSATS